MANYSTLGDLFTATADSIREMTHTTDAIAASEFPEKIKTIRPSTRYTGTKCHSKTFEGLMGLSGVYGIVRVLKNS